MDFADLASTPLQSSGLPTPLPLWLWLRRAAIFEIFYVYVFPSDVLSLLGVAVGTNLIVGETKPERRVWIDEPSKAKLARAI